MHPSVKEQNLQGIIYDRGKLRGKIFFKTLKYLSIFRRSQKGGVWTLEKLFLKKICWHNVLIDFYHFTDDKQVNFDLKGF